MMKRTASNARKPHPLRARRAKEMEIDPQTCEVKAVDRRKVAQILAKLPSDLSLISLAETFRVLGDPTRTKIIFALSQAELCVCDIASILGLKDSTVSHQLRTLRHLRLVKYRKEGRMVKYTLDDEHIEKLFKEGLSHIGEAGR